MNRKSEVLEKSAERARCVALASQCKSISKRIFPARKKSWQPPHRRVQRCSNQLPTLLRPLFNYRINLCASSRLTHRHRINSPTINNINIKQQCHLQMLPTWKRQLQKPRPRRNHQDAFLELRTPNTSPKPSGGVIPPNKPTRAVQTRTARTRPLIFLIGKPASCLERNIDGFHLDYLD